MKKKSLCFPLLVCSFTVVHSRLFCSENKHKKIFESQQPIQIFIHNPQNIIPCFSQAEIIWPKNFLLNYWNVQCTFHEIIENSYLRGMKFIIFLFKFTICTNTCCVIIAKWINQSWRVTNIHSVMRKEALIFHEQKINAEGIKIQL